MIFRRGIVVGEVVLILAGLAGCGGERASTTIDARNMSTYRVWRSRAAPDFRGDTWHEFDTAIQNIRLRAMTHGVLGENAIDGAVCQQVNGHTMSEVLIADYTAKLEELQATSKQMKEMIDQNALLIAKPGDADSAAELDRRRVEQQARLNHVFLDIDATSRRLAELKGVVAPVAMVSETSTTPAVLSREEALRQIKDVIHTRLDLATFRYGAWPVKVDRTGRLLDPSARTEFAQKRAAAAHTDHLVLPVRVGDEWWIFDDHVDVPSFSSAVTANLTPEDLCAVAERWGQSEAILWARKRAFDEPPEVAQAKRQARLQPPRGLDATASMQPQSMRSPVTEPLKPLQIQIEKPVIDTGLH